jgi:hypothetical protein
MARYIDPDALLSKLPDDLPYKASVKRVLMQAQEADVVPKIEVAALKIELEAMRTAANAYKMHYEKAKSEVEQFPCVAYNKKHERYQVIHKGKDGRIFASKFHHTRKDAEIALAELKKKYTEEKT